MTLKGLDRGKWQVTVVEEADAPLITVADPPTVPREMNCVPADGVAIIATCFALFARPSRISTPTFAADAVF